MGRMNDKKKKFERNGRSKNYPNISNKGVLEEYPDYKCNLRPNRSGSLEVKKEFIIKPLKLEEKNYLDEVFKKHTSNYCTIYQDFSYNYDEVLNYLVFLNLNLAIFISRSCV